MGELCESSPPGRETSQKEKKKKNPNINIHSWFIQMVYLLFDHCFGLKGGFPGGLAVKNLPAM